MNGLRGNFSGFYWWWRGDIWSALDVLPHLHRLSRGKIGRIRAQFAPEPFDTESLWCSVLVGKTSFAVLLIQQCIAGYLLMHFAPLADLPLCPPPALSDFSAFAPLTPLGASCLLVSSLALQIAAVPCRVRAFRLAAFLFTLCGGIGVLCTA